MDVVDSDIDTLDLASGVTELKNCLEILLGARPDAPLDTSAYAQQAADAERHARREKVALAAGELLGAAFAFVDQLLPASPAAALQPSVADAVRQQLAECLESDAAGGLKLTVTLPDFAALDWLAGSLARLLAIVPGNAASRPKEHACEVVLPRAGTKSPAPNPGERGLAAVGTRGR